MFRHIVLFQLSSPTQQNLSQTADILRSMEGKIEGLLSVEVGVDVLHSDRSYDIALNMTFQSRAHFDAYQTHPVHMPVKAHMHAVRKASVALDFEA